MDLNPPENLDPKLKEAYERIMGQKIPTPIIQNQVPEKNEIDNNFNKPEDSTEKTDMTHATQETLPPHYEEETTHKGRHKTLFVVIGIGAILFLIGYAVIWAKIFNLI